MRSKQKEIQTNLTPTCKNKTEVYSRVVGFYRPTSEWNLGKKEEFKIRKTFQTKNTN